jgi:hypothetical protein
VNAANIIPMGSNLFDVRFDSKPGSLLQGSLTLGQIAFNTVSNLHSTIARLSGDGVVGLHESGDVPLNGRVTPGRVFIVGLEPLLDAAPTTNGMLALTLYAQPNERYVIERGTNVFNGGPWSYDGIVSAVELKTELALRPMTAAMEYFRAYTVPASDLDIRIEGGQVIIEWPLECAGCVLEQSPELGVGAVWTETGVVPVEVNGVYRVTLPLTSEPRNYRLVVVP